MKSQIYALLHHITLNDIDICLITETLIQTDQDLQILDANISGLGYKFIDRHRENQPGGGIACIYKGHVDIRIYTKDNAYTSYKYLTVKLMIKSKLHWICTIYRSTILQQTSYTSIHFHGWISWPCITSSVSNWQPSNSWQYKHPLEYLCRFIIPLCNF